MAPVHFVLSVAVFVTSGTTSTLDFAGKSPPLTEAVCRRAAKEATFNLANLYRWRGLDYQLKIECEPQAR